VVYFKRKVYQKAMSELGCILTIDSVPVKAEGFLAIDKIPVGHDGKR